MTDPHAVDIATYHSANAAPGKEWLAYLVLPNSQRLPVAFFAPTEEQAKAEAQALWDKHAAEREANHKRREEAKRKAAAAKARKAEAA